MLNESGTFSFCVGGLKASLTFNWVGLAEVPLSNHSHKSCFLVRRYVQENCRLRPHERASSSIIEALIHLGVLQLLFMHHLCIKSFMGGPRGDTYDLAWIEAWCSHTLSHDK